MRTQSREALTSHTVSCMDSLAFKKAGPEEPFEGTGSRTLDEDTLSFWRK